MDMSQFNAVNNEAENRFELWIGEELAKIDYKIGKSGKMYMIHTEVPDKLEGNGIGQKLVREALEWVRENNIKIIPSCPYVKSFIKENRAEYEHLLVEGVKLG